ncbi:MAG: toprim domain-containing protein [Minisyncoccia bacterium]
MDPIEKLTEYFKEFPGIGERQAKRFVYFLMSRSTSYTDNLSSLITELKREVSQCKECFRFYIFNSNKDKLCDICSDSSTDISTLMIVEKDSDLESIKKSRTYHGKYFVLGGLVPIVEKNTKTRIRINELIEKIKENTNKGLKEVILAFSLSPQGDHTDYYVREQLKDITDSLSIKISSLGRGLSTGTELEYSDNETLKNALKNRS